MCLTILNNNTAKPQVQKWSSTPDAFNELPKRRPDTVRIRGIGCPRAGQHRAGCRIGLAICQGREIRRTQSAHYDGRTDGRTLAAKGFVEINLHLNAFKCATHTHTPSTWCCQLPGSMRKAYAINSTKCQKGMQTKKGREGDGGAWQIK